ncbi:MAG: cobalt ECF transporter T component CbiQ [Clostridiales bacterium]|jgi:cobalt/nickel transport system permease protein|nr:cobalt ECF transporter T component CbiQ [Clostridiales bacterium]
MSGILIALFIGIMLYGRVPWLLLAALCLGAAVLITLGRHRNTRFLTIDVLAQVSRLNRVSADLKFWTAIALTAVCASARSPATGVFLTVLMFLLIVCVGGLNPRDYLRLLALPASFLALSGLAMLFEISAQGVGIIRVPFFGTWLCVTEEARNRAVIVTTRAFGAIGCLYMLSLTTPTPDLIGVLRRTHCPDVLIDLMYLIYRDIFLMLSMYRAMRDAAKSRLGYVNYPTQVRTMGNLYANLLACGYQKAKRNFDAMESRCFDAGVRFLERGTTAKAPARAAAHTAAAIGIVGLSVLLR